MFYQQLCEFYLHRYFCLQVANHYDWGVERWVDGEEGVKGEGGRMLSTEDLIMCWIMLRSFALLRISCVHVHVALDQGTCMDYAHE